MDMDSISKMFVNVSDSRFVSENVASAFHLIKQELISMPNLDMQDRFVFMNCSAIVNSDQDDIDKQTIMFGLGKESGRFSTVYFLEVNNYTLFWLSATENDVAKRALLGFFALQ